MNRIKLYALYLSYRNARAMHCPGSRDAIGREKYKATKSTKPRRLTESHAESGTERSRDFYIINETKQYPRGIWVLKHKLDLEASAVVFGSEIQGYKNTNIIFPSLFLRLKKLYREEVQP
jgi:hypothetical protein